METITRVIAAYLQYERKISMKDDFMSLLAAPAKRALEHEGITTLQQLSAYTEKAILKLHGIGPSSMPKLRQALAEEGLAFKKADSGI
ncbi:hypothetical protein AMQ84_16225 [Paenibacillus riograndensis]|uniref:RNA polymerase alpha subunit C-terminal domain-containing protein n=1 Tax=Paenibacillus riograndensis TaxID=483937 RepID=A0A132TXP7_9BACL|nr:hypothetical protein AMQ84_16225 [Paenibacillus riograndensis]